MQVRPATAARRLELVKASLLDVRFGRVPREESSRERAIAGREWRGETPSEFTVYLDMVAADAVLPYVTQHIRRIEDNIE
ncbi:MAG TPA: hypothetical protein VN605_11690 [Thermoanaerobaculia bacterium]|nr:hypothetical protein [Thermoanaerobaculia bacterium]